jgi:hypothetical protein
MANEFGLPFKPIPDEFAVQSFGERQELYRRLCEAIWDPDGYGLDVPDRATEPEEVDEQKYYGVTGGFARRRPTQSTE